MTHPGDKLTVPFVRMRTRLLKDHLLNGHLYPKGSILNVSDRIAGNWQAAGIGEAVDEKDQAIRPKGASGPIPVPQTKDNPQS